MVIELGHFSLVLAFSVGLVALLLSFRKNKALLFYAAQAQMALISLSFTCLVLAFARSDFSVKSVALHSQSGTPFIYKIAATWGHHEGSMLLWCFFLSLIISFFSLNRQRIEEAIHQRALIILEIILGLFLAYSLFTSNPFERLMPFPINRGELNPLLQDPSLTFHPLFLYMGFLGFSVPFALSIASHKSSDPARFIQWVKPWIAGTWGFLTLGIITGSIWAYYELGWGGWWFWDPVESASLLPWLLAAALIHFYKKQTPSKLLFFLTSLGFLLCLASVWVIRGGALLSVHTFALSPNRSFFLLGIFSLSLCSSLFTLIKGKPFKRPANNRLMDSAVFIFLYLLFVVLWGIFFPIFFEKITHQSITLGTPYFSKLFCYPMLAAFFIMGIAPSYSKDFFKRYGLTLACLVLVLLGSIYFFSFQNLGAILSITLSLWVVGWTIIWGIKNFSKKSLSLIGAHLGIGILALGISVNEFYQFETMAVMEKGETLKITEGDLLFKEIIPTPQKNHLAYTATFQLKNDRKILCTFHPERRLYFAIQGEHSEASLCQKGLTTFSLILGETNDRQKWVVRLYKNPFIILIWLGGFLVAFSLFLLCFQKRALLILGFCFLWTTPTNALTTYHPRAISLFNKIPCPTCPGQNLEGSGTSLGIEVRDYIDHEIRAGTPEHKILDQLQEKFGLASPSRFPGWILWAVPFLFIGIFFMLYRRRR
jgi:cytochrome c-type biogenesis protein CcmF